MSKLTGISLKSIPVLAVLLLGSTAILAQSADTQSSDTPKTATRPRKSKMTQDQRFVSNAASGGMVEVKLGQLAMDKGASDTVKSFGQRMVDDHSQANDKLKAAAQIAHIAVPAKLSAKDQATYDRLAKMSGPAFDRDYSKEMVEDHVNDISDFKKEAKNGKADAIKGFASETLPTLEDHLKMARMMEKAVNASAANLTATDNHS